jgi:hypothetical protein
MRPPPQALGAGIPPRCAPPGAARRARRSAPAAAGRCRPAGRASAGGRLPDGHNNTRRRSDERRDVKMSVRWREMRCGVLRVGRAWPLGARERGMTSGCRPWRALGGSSCARMCRRATSESVSEREWAHATRCSSAGGSATALAARTVSPCATSTRSSDGSCGAERKRERRRVHTHTPHAVSVSDVQICCVMAPPWRAAPRAPATAALWLPRPPRR